MTNWFSTISLRWKLALVTVLATAVALVMSGVIMALYDARTYESQKVGAITSEAAILAASVTAALVFNDSDAAAEYLKSLEANPEIVSAAAYDASGTLVASYLRPGAQGAGVPDVAAPQGAVFEGGELGVFTPVMDNQEHVGTVYLKASVEPVGARLSRYALVLLFIGTGALAIALPLSLSLHKLISNPLEELAARNALVRTMLDTVDHGMMVVNKDKHIVFVNDRVSQLFNYKFYEGQDYAPLMKLAREHLGDAARENDGEHDRGQYSLQSGRTIEYRQERLPQGGFVRTYTDITEEKELQERLHQAKVKAEDAAMAKSQFLAAMSHEIRTPMSGVIGIVELLRATQLNDEQRQMVELIQRSGIGLLDVINDILDYSKIEAGRMTVEKTDCALGEIIESTAEVIGGHTQSKTLNIVCGIDPKIDAVVKGDPVRVRQIILNLMGNAVKFTETGTVAIEAKTQSTTEETISVLFEVSDTGMGISPEQQAKLFQAFSQADYSTTRKFGGTGLGLSICKNLVALMGGEIGVRSEEGKGSTFWFSVPFERLPAEQRRDGLGTYAGALKDLRLIVYDPAAPLSASARYLRAAGADVLEPRKHTEMIGQLYDEAGAGRKIDAMVICVRIGDANVAGLMEKMAGPANPAKVPMIVVAPHLSGSAAKIAHAQRPAAVLSAPLRRSKFYDAVARVAGRAVRKEEENLQTSGLTYVAPSREEAIAGGSYILVAEDNQTNQFVIKSQLNRLGFAAEFANDGREAWEAVSRDPMRYAMLITDCHMPFIDGYQLTGLIRDSELEGPRRLPIVALTANALQGEADICRAAGMDGYMFKPTDMATLEAMILKWVPQAAMLRRALSTPQPAAPPIVVSGLNGGKGPAVDTSVLATLLGSSDPRALREMLQLYLETELQTPEMLRNLTAAGDRDGLAKAAHAAKGAASSAGAQRLMELCKNLENCAPHEDWTKIAALSAEIDGAFAEVRAFIESY